MMARNARGSEGSFKVNSKEVVDLMETNINCPAVLPETVTIKVELPDIFIDNSFDDEVEPILHRRRDSLRDNFFENVTIKQEVKEEEGNQGVSKVPKTEPTEARPAFAAVFIKEEEEDCPDMYDESGIGESNQGTRTNVTENDDDDIIEIIPQKNNTKVPVVTILDDEPNKSSFKPVNIKSQPVMKPYECAHCPASFKEKLNLRQHIVTHSCQEHFSCPNCPRKFVYPGNLERHLREHRVTSKLYSCPSCNSNFKLKSLLDEHIQLHYFPLPCPQCKARFANRKHLNSHLKIHIGNEDIFKRQTKKPEPPPQIPVILTEDDRDDEYTPSRATASDQFRCGFCRAVFLNQRDLAEHTTQSHMNKLPKTTKKRIQTFKCHLCPSRYRREYKLDEHLRIHANMKPRNRYPCTNCPAKFSDEDSFKEHMKNHLKDKPLKCKRCFEQFALTSHLKSHLKMCTKVKPYSCMRCPAEFKLKDDLLEHFRTDHSVDPMFTCAHCFAEFAKKEDLVSHLPNHSFDNPCPICLTNFNLESDLKAHLKVHAAETIRANNGTPLIPLIKDNFDSFKSDTYICGHCSTKCKDKDTLIEHLGAHLDQKPRYLGVFTKQPFTRTALVNEMKKNFANIKLRFGRI